ncbi:hypothetical protein COCOBI_18-1190 [Coccomyxa sp. Obi]|nr:hypothetical protein COCOBI_18-1190 [Coccomyxa sp. Obi]
MHACNHRPEFRALKPLEDEQYSLLAGNRMGDPRYRKYQERMRDLGFYFTVSMLEASGYCLPEGAQARYDSLYSKREQTCRAQGRRVSSIEESADESEDSEEVDYSDEDTSDSTIHGRRRRPNQVLAAVPPSRKRARKAPAEGLAMDPESLKQAQSHGLQDSVAKRTHHAKPAEKSRALPRAGVVHAAAMHASIKVEPAAPVQPPHAAEDAADSGLAQRRALISSSAAPAGQLTSAACPSAAAAAAVQPDANGPAFAPDAAKEGTRKRRRTPAMQPDLARPAAPKQDAPVDPSSLAARSIPAHGQALSYDMDQTVDLTLDSPTFSAGKGSSRSRTRVYTLGDVIRDINRLKAVQSQIAASGVRIDIDRVLQYLQVASHQEQQRTQQLEPRIDEVQAEASAERRNHQEALLEMQRQATRNEKLLAAKDNEIKGLREQVELQRT